jgi:hypothetical protein
LLGMASLTGIICRQEGRAGPAERHRSENTDGVSDCSRRLSGAGQERSLFTPTFKLKWRKLAQRFRDPIEELSS